MGPTGWRRPSGGSAATSPLRGEDELPLRRLRRHLPTAWGGRPRPSGGSAATSRLRGDELAPPAAPPPPPHCVGRTNSLLAQGVDPGELAVEARVVEAVPDDEPVGDHESHEVE